MHEQEASPVNLKSNKNIRKEDKLKIARETSIRIIWIWLLEKQKVIVQCKRSQKSHLQKKGKKHKRKWLQFQYLRCLGEWQWSFQHMQYTRKNSKWRRISINGNLQLKDFQKCDNTMHEHCRWGLFPLLL